MKSILIAIVIATVGTLYYIHKEFPISEVVEGVEVPTRPKKALRKDVEVPTVVVGTPETPKDETPKGGAEPEKPEAFNKEDNKEFFKARHKRNFERYQTLKAQIKEEILQNQNGLLAASNVSPNFKEGSIRTSNAQREAWKAQKARNVQAWRYKVDKSKERLKELEKAWRDVEAQYRKDLR